MRRHSLLTVKLCEYSAHGLTRLDTNGAVTLAMRHLPVRPESIFNARHGVIERAAVSVFIGCLRVRARYFPLFFLLARILAKVGLAQRNLHFLRHSFVSLLLQQEESTGYVEASRIANY